MRIQNISALFVKQGKDCAKNAPVLLLFFIYPFVALVLTQAMKDQAGSAELFVSIFATMHAVFTPIVAASSFIAEEREKNTLRALIMSNVTLKEYLLSTGGFIILANLLTGLSFIFLGNMSANISSFILAMVICGLISTLLGCSIGLFCRNAAAANGLAVPLGILFAFLPMLANFNKSLDKISSFIYSGQLARLMAGRQPGAAGIALIIINLAILAGISGLLYKKSLTEE